MREVDPRRGSRAPGSRPLRSSESEKRSSNSSVGDLSGVIEGAELKQQDATTGYFNITVNTTGDSIDGAIFNKCDPVNVGISCSVSIENRLLVLIVKDINKLAPKKKKTYI